MLSNESILRLAATRIGPELARAELRDTDGVFVQIQNGKITIGGQTVPQKLRACTLAHLNAHKERYTVSQQPSFDTLGAMLDMSRGGVMRPEQVKEFILRLALCGANQLMLYTEDIYTLEEYPHFGYLRGAYSDDELRDMDAYAAELGVEIVPCIQTLGHMAQYLTWNEEAKDMKDTDAVLLCDSEETDRFIEAALRKMRSVFRSGRIHIGMDEARDMGLGAYYRKHGACNRYEILQRHLARVCRMCQELGLQPMMWSDMFFRIGSKNGKYYDTDVVFPQGLADRIPLVDLVYWDYYHEDTAFYESMLDLHAELRRPVIFAGTVYTTRGFLPNLSLSHATTAPALAACAKRGIREVFATMWGDDGCETDYFDALYGFAQYSEACYAPEADADAIAQMGSFLSGITPQLAGQMDAFFLLERPKYLIWGDVFFNQTGVDFSIDRAFEQVKKVADGCENTYVSVLLRILYTKALIYADLQQDYRNGRPLDRWAKQILPALLEDYRTLFSLHGERWLALNKPFGFEVLQARYAATIQRLEYAIQILDRYVSGGTDHIEELEYTPVFGEGRAPWYNFVAFTRVMNFY